MDTARLNEIIMSTTSQYRKGGVIERDDSGGIEKVDVFAMPHVDEAKNEGHVVDLHFVSIAVDKEAAEAVKGELSSLLDAWPEEAWGHPTQKLSDGPSYISVGGVLGDQGLALSLFALGEVIGFWNVITPERLGIDGERADLMAGAGYVMTDGYRPTA